MLIAAAGLAVDLGNLYLAKTRLQSSVDAGALAGSLQLPYDPDVTNGKVAAAATDIVHKNFDAAHVKSVAAGTEVRSVCVKADTAVPLILMGVLGLSANTVTSSACAGFNNLEVALVIDNSGSMAGDPITKTKAAAVDLVNLILPDTAAPSTKVGLVPFRGKVHLPAGVNGLAEGCVNSDGTLDKWEFNASTSKMATQTRPSSCFDGIPVTQPLSTDKAAVVGSINRMTGTGTTSGTIIAEGIKWAAQVLTPEAPFTEGGDPKKFHKIMILLTDGDNEDGRCGGSFANTSLPNPYWNNAYFGLYAKYDGTKTYSQIKTLNTADCRDGGVLDQAMLTEAQKAKTAGIEIFSIRFGDSDTNDKTLMKKVASSKTGTDDHYYDAPDASHLGDIFKEIGKQLGWRLLN